ncbi:MAG: beta-lactamase family protein [Clostridia bacterium]|nr:beta-lactamase family protein [Clostridia bacterium]
MNFSALDTLLKQLPERGIPGGELLVTQNHQVLYHQHFGHSDASASKPSTSDDLYWIFSMTKIFTCTCAMRLIEEGKLALSDPVSRYIPAFADLSVADKQGNRQPAKQTMTVLHLFTMTGGLNYSLRSPSMAEAFSHPDMTTLDFANAAAKVPLGFEPGTHYCYSHCHDVLAAVVEVASGKRFSDYVDELIFRPLGLQDIGFRPNEEQLARFAQQYLYQNGTGKAVPQPLKNNYAPFAQYDSGGAGIFSNAESVARFLDTLACEGQAETGYSMLLPQTVAQMGENRLCDDALNDFVSRRFFGYGYGLCGRVHIAPSRSFSLSPAGEFGWDGAAGAYGMIDTKHHLSICYVQHVMGCNYAYQLLHPYIRNTVYQALDLS